jgi:uncharacterized protein
VNQRDRHGLEILDRDASLQLLAGRSVGRLAVVDGNQPLILPVNYALDGEAIVLRSDDGRKLRAGTRSPVCFEVDDFDESTRSGWDVVVTGRLEEVTPFDAATLDRVHRLPVTPWAEGDKRYWLRLVPGHIGGRRIPRPAVG